MGSTVAVAMTVYNDAQFLPKAIESVLGQSFTDLTLHIFDNYSPDPEVAKILQHYAQDPRVVIEPMPKGLAGIGVMDYWWGLLKGRATYTITIGGHDCWNTDGFLATLVERMEQNVRNYATIGQKVALVYADTWQADADDRIHGRYQSFFQFAGEVPERIKPLMVIGTVNSPQLFGLWNEDVRQHLPMRSLCSGWDHLVVTEAAQHGHILYEPRVQLVMRLPKPDDDLTKYGLRHLTAEQRAAGPRDFYQQLEWLRAALDQGIATLPPEQQQNYDWMVTAAMGALYMALRGHNLLIVPGAMQGFMADPDAVQMVSALRAAAVQFDKLVAKA